MLDVIAFDGDDTLWHSESFFEVTQQRFAELLAAHVEADALSELLLETERGNLAVFGYGVKGFTLSMIETAVEVVGDAITAEVIETIIGWGKEMLHHPVELLDGVEETLRVLGRDHRLALVTKGDLFHQESKIAQSGLGDLFDHVAVVAEKDEACYRRVTAQLGVPPEGLLMVGNSLRSDVLPVVAIGAKAVHVPYHITWELEVPDEEAIAAHDHWRIDDIRDLPRIVDEITGTGGDPRGATA